MVSHRPNSIAHRNAIGAHSGSYSIYRALAMALNTLDPAHVPDYTNTEPPFPINPNPSWFDDKKIVSLDPFGHLAQTEFASFNARGLDVRPTISLTKAHIKMSELDHAYNNGSIKPDGKIVHNSLPREAFPGQDAGVEVAVHKAAVEPVWHLPGLAHRFKISEDLLRRALFEGESPDISRYRIPTVTDTFDLILLRRNGRDVPRVDHPTRPQSLPSPHRRPDRVHLREPRTPLGPEQRAHLAGPRRVQRVRRVR